MSNISPNFQPSPQFAGSQRLRRIGLAAAAAGAVGLLGGATAASASADTTPGSTQGQVVVDPGDHGSFSVRLPGNPLPKTENETCSVTQSPGFNDTTIQCAKDNTGADTVRDFAELIGIVLASWGVGKFGPLNRLKELRAKRAAGGSQN